MQGMEGSSLVVQWLRLCAPNIRGLGLIPGSGTRSHMLQLKSPHTATKRPCMQQLKIPHDATNHNQDLA